MPDKHPIVTQRSVVQAKTKGLPYYKSHGH